MILNKLMSLFKEHIDIVAYLFFGVCTTLVNVFVYWIAAHPMGIGVVPSAIVAWFAAVYFAYETNRRWVFHSKAVTPKEIFQELVAFFSCRFLTGVFDWVIMYTFVDVMGMCDLVIKIIANVVVIVLNFIASKWIIFRG